MNVEILLKVSRILPERFTDIALRVFHDQTDDETYSRVEGLVNLERVYIHSLCCTALSLYITFSEFRNLLKTKRVSTIMAYDIINTTRVRVHTIIMLHYCTLRMPKKMSIYYHHEISHVQGLTWVTGFTPYAYPTGKTDEELAE